MKSDSGDTETVFTEVVGVLGQYCDLSSCRLEVDSVLGEDIPLDSAQMLRVITRLEALKGMQFRPEDLLKLRTLGDLVDLTQRRAGGL